VARQYGWTQTSRTGVRPSTKQTTITTPAQRARHIAELRCVRVPGRLLPVRVDSINLIAMQEIKYITRCHWCSTTHFDRVLYNIAAAGEEQQCGCLPCLEMHEPEHHNAIIQAQQKKDKRVPVRKGIECARNAPCPCKSGRKYKHCCMNEVAAGTKALVP
jgi:hypothetical protein